MKKILAFLLAAMMVFALAACGNTDDPAPSENNPPATSQTDKQDSGEENNDEGEDQEDNDTSHSDTSVPSTGTPLDWPDNDYTKLVPTPNIGGKVLSSGEIGKLFTIELKWSMDQGIAYAQQLQEAGFGDDCVEKYEKNGYIDRTANGINVQLMDLFGVTSLTIMKAE